MRVHDLLLVRMHSVWATSHDLLGTGPLETNKAKEGDEHSVRFELRPSGLSLALGLELRLGDRGDV